MTDPPLRIAIVGLGAIGGWVGGRLALAGRQVSALVREGRALSGGIALHEGERTDHAPIVRSSDASTLGPQDLVVLAVKAPALATVVAAVHPLIGPNTLILPMLNGVPWWFMGGERIDAVDPHGTIDAALPVAQTVGCVVHAAVRRDPNGAIRVQHADKLLLGELGGGLSDRVQRLCAIVADAGIRAVPHDQIREAIWYKLWGNMTINPVSALTLATADRIIGDPQLRGFIVACMDEAAAVGAAVGCPIAENAEDRLAVTARLGGFKTSMLQDVEAGRRIELEALLGAPRELARRAGIPCPNIDALYGMTRLFAEGRGLL